MKLIDGLQPLTIGLGEFIFHQGDEGHEFFIIEEGLVECLIEKGEDEPRCVRVLRKDDHFGELSLVNNEARSLGIRVISETCKLHHLDRDTFTRMLGSIKHLLKVYNDTDSEMPAS